MAVRRESFVKSWWSLCQNALLFQGSITLRMNGEVVAAAIKCLLNRSLPSTLLLFRFLFLSLSSSVSPLFCFFYLFFQLFLLLSPSLPSPIQFECTLLFPSFSVTFYFLFIFTYLSSFFTWSKITLWCCTKSCIDMTAPVVAIFLILWNWIFWPC